MFAITKIINSVCLAHIDEKRNLIIQRMNVIIHIVAILPETESRSKLYRCISYGRLNEFHEAIFLTVNYIFYFFFLIFVKI